MLGLLWERAGIYSNYFHIVEGLVSKNNKRWGFFGKMNRERWCSYWKKGRGQGAKGKMPFLFLPSPVKQGRGRKAPGGAWAGGLGARRRPWGGEKGEGSVGI